MSDTKEKLAVLGVVVLSFLWGFAWGANFSQSTADQLKAEAVASGYAEWRIVDPKTGRTEFQWLPPHNLGAKHE